MSWTTARGNRRGPFVFQIVISGSSHMISRAVAVSEAFYAARPLRLSLFLFGIAARFRHKSSQRATLPAGAPRSRRSPPRTTRSGRRWATARSRRTANGSRTISVAATTPPSCATAPSTANRERTRSLGDQPAVHAATAAGCSTRSRPTRRGRGGRGGARRPRWRRRAGAAGARRRQPQQGRRRRSALGCDHDVR